MSASIAVGRAAGPRGFRNLNPGNIRKGQDWKGLAPRGLGVDPEFDTFISAAYGFRALVKIILNYKKKYGINTVRGIISRWAPPNENDTEGYIRFVSVMAGFGADQELPFDNHTLFLLAKAISIKENGRRPESGRPWFEDRDIFEGVTMALEA
jgi:hypothetical protein